MDKHVVVTITTPSEEVGMSIANTLLGRKLAAAVNIVPSVRSLYVWQGEIQNAQEALLIVKTKAALFAELASVVQSLHPYEVPGIIALPVVMGSESYLDWIDAEVAEE